ncbi:2857_t:CDS:1, partial [Acaulospora colombiana]
MPESAEPESIADIVEVVYEQCWTEFYQWEPEYCKQRLKDLRESQPARDWFEDWSETEDWDPNDIASSEPIYSSYQSARIEIASVSIGVQHNGSSEPTTTMAPMVKISTNFPS